MPRSLKVVIQCENCMTEIENEEHDGALTLTINGVGPKQIDLCPTCLKGEDFDGLSVKGFLALFEEAHLLPAEQPRPASRRSRNTNQSQPSTCPACGHVAGSPQGLGRHTRTEHGVTVAEMRDPAVLIEVQKRMKQ